jgi:hypothetical protein
VVGMKTVWFAGKIGDRVGTIYWQANEMISHVIGRTFTACRHHMTQFISSCMGGVVNIWNWLFKMDRLRNTNCRMVHHQLSDGSPLVSMVAIDENIKFPLNIQYFLKVWLVIFGE